MHTAIPMPLRAAAGLAAIAIDEARRLPRRVVTLPVLAAGTAMQATLKVQQQYTHLAARGDQLLSQLRGAQDDTPPWARFDEDEEEAGAPPPRTDTVPLEGYEALSIPQLRARLRRLSEDDLVTLIAYEQAHEDRAPYVTLLENRLSAVRG